MAAVLPPDDDWLIAHYPTIRESLRAKPKILELGCGRGRDTVHLIRFGHVVATDINASALAACAAAAPQADILRLDLKQSLPFPDDTFGFILASLSIHYFSWNQTDALVSEMLRCLATKGRCIVRLNSTKDTNYGAASNDVIEDNFFRVGLINKRFFDRDAIERLFRNWQISRMVEYQINRYEKHKWVWEIELHG